MLKLSDVWAVVTNWNGGSRNLACIASLIEGGLPPERIVFVDNASVDGSLELVRGAHPGLCFIENASNLGFAEGASVGAARALAGACRAVFFVNNDVVLLPGCLEPLLAVLDEEPRVEIELQGARPDGTPIEREILVVSGGYAIGDPPPEFKF